MEAAAIKLSPDKFSTCFFKSATFLVHLDCSPDNKLINCSALFNFSLAFFTCCDKEFCFSIALLYSASNFSTVACAALDLAIASSFSAFALFFAAEASSNFFFIGSIVFSQLWTYSTRSVKYSYKPTMDFAAFSIIFLVTFLVVNKSSISWIFCRIGGIFNSSNLSATIVFNVSNN